MYYINAVIVRLLICQLDFDRSTYKSTHLDQTV